ncbi:YdiK family protein [Virgibacillus profundi]|nr:YdiK family protein [Virgibacillus profundi]
MRTSPLIMAIVYFIMGIFFVYIAVQSADETIWNFTTVVIALFATLDFGVSIRLISIHFRIKNKKKE